jgi:hypothetical protein
LVVRQYPRKLLVQNATYTNTFGSCTNMPITDAKLRVLKSKTAQFKLADAEGLYILVAPGGSKMWRLAYRFNGKQKTLALGHYPVVSLLEAQGARRRQKAAARWNRPFGRSKDTAPEAIHRCL